MKDETNPARKITVSQNLAVEATKLCHFLFRLHPLAPGPLLDAFSMGGRVLVGRAPEEPGAIVARDPMMSRVHAELRRCSPGPYVAVDRDSKNGLFVDGTRVSRATVGDGSILRMGNSLFVVRAVGLSLPEPPSEKAGFIGFTPCFRVAEESCRKVAPSATTVLLTGETGTGKEVLAKYVHTLSGRPGRFLPVNCAALSPSLFESALFGHRRGSFSGAVADFAGHAREAHKGTLFLDEVGELPIETQAKLLRFLETGELATIGDATPGTADVRLVAATNRDLEDAVRRGEFRQDLYARLAQWVIRIPPLRDRPEDVALLARRSLGSLTLSADAAEALCLHDWPYNVRELLALFNELRLRLPPETAIVAAHLPEAVRSRVDPRRSETTGHAPAEPGVRSPTRAEVQALLQECGGNVSEVARRLGKDRRQVYRWIQRTETGT